MEEILNKVMSKAEDWRLNEAKTISESCQIVAFHLSCLTEEKFRMYKLTGFDFKGLQIHQRMREDIFALEWGIRSLQNLPDIKNTTATALRKKWSDKIIRKCQEYLKSLSNYSKLRDLTVCAKRGGYEVSNPEPEVIIFKDVPEWLGKNDHKCHLISDKIEKDRTMNIDQFNLKGFSLDKTYAFQDFPHNLRSSMFHSSAFWSILSFLHKLCIDKIIADSRTFKPGSRVRTSHTKNLTIIRTKKGLSADIANNTGLEKNVVNTILRWLLFNSETLRKFSLFHCPLIDINQRLVLIIPHSVIIGFPPTSFLRLLAHYDKRSFDSASSRMEKERLNQIIDHIGSEDLIITDFRASN